MKSEGGDPGFEGGELKSEGGNPGFEGGDPKSEGSDPRSEGSISVSESDIPMSEGGDPGANPGSDGFSDGGSRLDEAKSFDCGIEGRCELPAVHVLRPDRGTSGGCGVSVPANWAAFLW